MEKNDRNTKEKWKRMIEKQVTNGKEWQRNIGKIEMN